MFLVNAVLVGCSKKTLSLEGLLSTTEYMSSHLLLKNVLDALDARRRALIWTDEDTCNGSQCLIEWERLYVSKACGGLGIKNLADDNHSLLMKFIVKLHDPTPLSWKNWFHKHAAVDDGSFLHHIVTSE